MEANSISAPKGWPGDNPARTKTLLFAAFDAGKLLNNLARLLEQSTIILGTTQPIAPVLCHLNQVWNELAMEVFKLLPDLNSAVQMSEVLREESASWQALLVSEEFHLKACLSLDELKVLCNSDSLVHGNMTALCLNELIGNARSKVAEIKSLLAAEMTPMTQLWSTFLLGEIFDQGLRPWDLCLHNITQVQNTSWREATRIGLGGTRSGSRTSRYRLVIRSLREVRVSPMEDWIPTVTEIGQRLGISIDSSSLFSTRGKRCRGTRLVRAVNQLEEQIKKGLEVLATKLVGDQNGSSVSTTETEYQALVRECLVLNWV